MKEKILLLLVTIGTATSIIPCCEEGYLIRKPGVCGEGNATTMINLNCTMGYMPLKDIILQGTKLSTQDAPNFIFAENPDDYCIGRMLWNESMPELGDVAAGIVCFQKQFTQKDIEKSGILTLVSVGFLLLTFSVYLFLPRMRDLQGLCYMSLCISMALGFFWLGLLQLNPGFEALLCNISGFLVYFWMMATFFWMNVICINVYRTVNDATHLKNTERQQFFFYSCYAWGCTTALLIVSLVTNYIEGDHLKPGIDEYSCWFKERTETWVFFYGPIAILLAANVILFVSSSVKLWNQGKKYEVSRLSSLKYKFLLSLKLFLVMGISWIFEIASFAHGENHIIWRIADIFNCLQGLVIFLILVVLRRRVIKAFVDIHCCSLLTGSLLDKLSPDEDSCEELMIDDEHVEVRLN